MLELFNDEQLSIDELVADHIREDENGIVGRLVLGIGEVGGDCAMSKFLFHSIALLLVVPTVVNVFNLAFCFSFVLDTDGAAAGWWVGCHYGSWVVVCK